MAKDEAPKVQTKAEVSSALNMQVATKQTCTHTCASAFKRAVACMGADAEDKSMRLRTANGRGYDADAHE